MAQIIRTRLIGRWNKPDVVERHGVSAKEWGAVEPALEEREKGIEGEEGEEVEFVSMLYSFGDS